MIKVRMFSLNPESRWDFFCYTSELKIGSFELNFSIFLSHWNVNNYLNQWRDGIERIRNKNKSCLITGLEERRIVEDEGFEPEIWWLVLYKQKDSVKIQKLHFSEEVYSNYIGKNVIITEKNCYDFIPVYSPYYPIYPSLPQVFWELQEQELSKKFSISITNDAVDTSYFVPVITGLVYIGSYTQEYKIPINYWSIDTYKKQWKEGVKRLQTYPSSCLITSISEPMGALGRWLLYKRDGKIIFYYDYFYGVDYQREIGDVPLTEENCYDFIPDEQEHLEKYRVKEWEVDLKEFDGLEVIWPEK